jgi:hypothetical protein
MKERDIIAKFKAEAAELDGDGDETETRRENKQFEREVEDAKEFFGMWDQGDEVSWALLRVVKAQNDLAHAYDMHADGVATVSVEFNRLARSAVGRLLPCCGRRSTPKVPSKVPKCHYCHRDSGWPVCGIVRKEVNP